MALLPVHRTASRFLQCSLLLIAAFLLAAMTARAASVAPHAEDWSTQRVLDPQGLGYDKFGRAVAMSGSVALVSASEATLGDHSAQGKVLVYERAADGAWNLTQTLTAADGAAFNEFGWSVAVSGRVAVIGAINATIGEHNSQGAAYVFVRGDDGVWTQTQKLVAADGTSVDWFGSAVAMNEETIVVAAYGAHYNDQMMRGSLYVFTQVGGTWTQTQQLVAADGDVGDGFGFAIALSGSTLLASSPGAEIGGRHAQGAVYRFVRTDGAWSQRQKVVVAEGAENDQLGSALAVDGDTALIGAMWREGGAGVVYVFGGAGGDWTQQQRLAASDGAARGVDGIGLPPTDNFGITLALQGDTALVGASNVTVSGTEGQGAAYLFRRSGGTFGGAHTFTEYDGIVSPYFGAAVALDGDEALIGMYGYTPDWDHYQQGAAYFYRRASNGIPASERAVLVDLYDSTGGAGWWDMNGWLGEPGSECSWTGVTCDEAGAHVVGLSFGFTNMVGTLPPSLNQLTGLVSLQIADQPQLGGVFPSLAGMTGLQTIDVRNTGLTGALPSLAGLTALQSATFLGNQFDGAIPPFGELPALAWFSASGNQLSGTIPSLDGLPALTGFFVGNNHLSGPPPAPPAGLGEYGGELCPNALDHVESPAWDTITGIAPWYRDCTATPTDAIFGDGFDGT
ncbi:hypothetical protein [Dokdonella sp.]|uniref:hypothetical protein n=1 Tax=Dokdonella sp. TaxID=2291710 RepID=UPI001B18C43C|nr:hypothetical protein [Dokdonella sp.]MBO9661596.1 hypothetical protein [Dokdonella sp.]